MKREHIEITVCTAIGVAAGYLIGFALAYLWVYLQLIGPLFGGLIGYLCVEPKQTWAGIKNAWKKANSAFIRWKKIRNTLLHGICFTVTATFFVWIGFALFQQLNVLPINSLRCKLVIFLNTMYVIGIFFSLILAIDAVFLEKSLKDTFLQDVGMDFFEKTGIVKFFENYVIGKSKFFLYIICLFGNLLFLIYVASWFWILLHALYKFCKCTITFFVELGVQIHSKKRLIVGVDAVIGGFISLAMGNPLPGMIIGALWALINYELISRIVFKVKPQ